jgi:hypothetical protein
VRRGCAGYLRTSLSGIPAYRDPAMRRMLRLLEWCVAASIIGMVVGLLLPGPDFDQTYRYPSAILNSGNDLADIAGEYLIEHKYGARHLSILFDGRYSAFSKACTGVGDRESGYVRRAGTCYVLSQTTANEGLRERVFLPIRWESRRYLIPPERMQEFCDAIINGDEPRNGGGGNYYLRFPRNPVSGIPELPDQWASYLKQNLMTGEIVEAMEGGCVKIDAGKAKGIHIGGVLTVQGREQYGPQRLFVVSVEDESCIAKKPGLGHAEPPLTVGRHVVAQSLAP